MIKKLIIVPWFGPFPEWMDKYRENIKHLQADGYDWLITDDLNEFSQRVEKAIGWGPNIKPGTSGSHNYRTAFGLIYADVLKDYDFWGITDLDCAYGDVKKFIPDETLSEIDIHANHDSYICGPWTLFRNNDTVNNLFRSVPNWASFMRDEYSHPGRWTEVEFSKIVDREHNAGKIKRLYTHFQGKNPDDFSQTSFDGQKLYDGKDEIMMVHFNHTKKWPL